MFTLCSCILLESIHFGEHHKRNLISIRGMKITLEYIVNLLLLGSFHLTYTAYQSLAAPLPSYCISLPYARTLSAISLCIHREKQTASYLILCLITLYKNSTISPYKVIGLIDPSFQGQAGLYWLSELSECLTFNVMLKQFEPNKLMLCSIISAAKSILYF